jgi:hypothetical protein
MGKLRYVALKKLKVSGEYRLPGDEVPEAGGWRNLAVHVARGAIAVLEGTDEQATKTVEPASNTTQYAVDTAGTEEEAENLAELREAEEDDERNIERTGNGEWVDLTPYHAGHGWYEIPGADKKLRRDEAVAYLLSLPVDSTTLHGEEILEDEEE